jgi:transcriptional regulator with XRE-family HTH domain
MGTGTFGGRLRAAAEDRGLTQAQLADLSGTTQPAISQFMRDLRLPSAGALSRLAAAVGVEIDWLLRGEGRRPESVARPSAIPTWHFRKAYGDGTRLYSNAAIEVFNPSLRTATREIGQNTKDAPRDGEIRLELSLIEITGDRLHRFLKAIDWPALEEHYRAVASDTKHRSSAQIADALDRMKREKRLLLFRAEDYGTTGLLGADDEDGPFSALVKRIGDSSKTDELSAGGRYGLGKHVFSRLSAFDLVLFSSDLSEPIDSHNRGRFMGRTFFPYHKLSGEEYEGYCFFGAGEPEGRVRRSVWNAGQILEELSLSRLQPDDFDGYSTGTSILAVGFDAFADDQKAPIRASLTEMQTAAAEAFWPALAAGTFSIALNHFENDRLLFRTLIDPNEHTPLLVEMLGEYRATTASESSSDNLFLRNIPLQVPRKRDGSALSVVHEAKLVVRIPSDDELRLIADSDRSALGRVAAWRKPEMIVRSMDFDLGLGARPFHAAIICGEAAGSSEADTAAEHFLALCEPPAHDNWTADLPDLSRIYVRPIQTALHDFKARIRDALREIVIQRSSTEDRGPADLKKLFEVPTDTIGDFSKAAVRPITLQRVTVNGRQKLRSILRPPRSRGKRWRFQMALMSESEYGGPVKIPTDVECESNSTQTGAFVTVQDSLRDVTLLLEPRWSECDVEEQFAALFVDVTRTEAEDLTQ